MEASIVITTKNRKEELRQALLSCRTQSHVAEVLVLDDASTDGTSEMLREEFPEVKVERTEESAGLIVQRNKGAKLAKGDVIFSLDDDAEFSHPDVVADTLAYPGQGAAQGASLDYPGGARLHSHRAAEYRGRRRGQSR